MGLQLSYVTVKKNAPAVMSLTPLPDADDDTPLPDLPDEDYESPLEVLPEIEEGEADVETLFRSIDNDKTGGIASTS